MLLFKMRLFILKTNHFLKTSVDQTHAGHTPALQFAVHLQTFHRGDSFSLQTIWKSSSILSAVFVEAFVEVFNIHWYYCHTCTPFFRIFSEKVILVFFLKFAFS